MLIEVEVPFIELVGVFVADKRRRLFTFFCTVDGNLGTVNAPLIGPEEGLGLVLAVVLEPPSLLVVCVPDLAKYKQL